MVRKEFLEPILARNMKTYLRGWYFGCCPKGEKAKNHNKGGGKKFRR